jgi:hypothetical protein
MLLGTLVLFPLFSLGGCSGDSGPLTAPSRSYPFRPAYYYMYENQEIWLDTSSELLAIRFYESVSQSAVDRLLGWWGLGTRNEPKNNTFELYIVWTKNAFEQAPVLWKQVGLVEYVGPILQWGVCGGEPRYVIPGNQIIVKGDVLDEEIASWLADASATVVSRRSPTHVIYELPWGDAGELFDLANRIHRHSAIEFAEPNFLIEICHGAHGSLVRPPLSNSPPLLTAPGSSEIE